MTDELDPIASAFEDYITEVGPDAVAAQFDVPIEAVQARKLNAEIVRFLFARQAQLHESQVRQLAAQPPAKATPAGPAPRTAADPLPFDPRIPDAQQQPIRRVPGGPTSTDWITPVPNKRQDSGPVPNSPVM